MNNSRWVNRACRLWSQKAGKLSL